MIIELLENQKLTEEEFTQWVRDIKLPLTEVADYQIQSNFNNFLAAIDFKLEVDDRVSENLKVELLKYLKNY